MNKVKPQQRKVHDSSSSNAMEQELRETVSMNNFKNFVRKLTWQHLIFGSNY